MTKQWKTGDLVKCLATRFDDESEDFQGRKFSERHSLEGHGAYVHGVVKRVLGGKHNREGCTRVHSRWHAGVDEVTSITKIK